ncbi:MAG: hypothetical protein IJ150_12575 [Bacteroidales bacterium]|nr:hypothetical protein [Bacteroidales bacterium]
MKIFFLTLCFSVIIFSSSCNLNSNFEDRQITDSSITNQNLVRRIDYKNKKGRIIKYDTYYLDTLTQYWILSSRNELFYTQKGKIAKEKLYVPNQYLELNPLQLDSFVFNDKDLKIESVHLVSSGNSNKWMKVSRHVFQYLKDDTLAFSEKIFSWDMQNKNWFRTKEYYYEYDSLGRVSSRFTYSLNKYDTSKVEKNFEEFFYPDENLLPLP